MTETTPRLALPLLAAGQAQKEMAHNEALAALDLQVQPVVEAVGGNEPPAAPLPGQCWIVGPAPAGDWAGHPGAIAGWTAGGWRFAAPQVGMMAWSLADAVPVRRSARGWQVGTIDARRMVVDGRQVVGARGGAIPGPAGGAAIDVEARAAIDAILGALRTHGLIGE